MAKVIRKKQTHWTRFLVVLLATWAMAASNAEAAFPTVAATNTSVNDSDTTSHVVSLPAGIASGDLLIVFIAIDTRDVIPAMTFTWPVGWTELYDQEDASDIGHTAGYRRADGGEGATITVTSTEADQSAHVSYRITGHHATSDPESANTTGSGTGADPPGLNPANWGAEDTLWLIGAGLDRPGTGNSNFSTDPTNYTDAIEGTGANSTGTRMRSLRRELNIASYPQKVCK